MPEIPGLSDAGNCRDWETSIPIDLEKIRDKDEDYWKHFRGTPKAFINAGQAASMWQNRFGKYTQVRFPAETDPVELGKSILARLRPSDTGMMIREPAREGLAAASSGVDFSGLFLGLSFFLIAGGIILTVLLIRLGLEGRHTQIGTLRAIGWPEQRIRQQLLWENFMVAFAGTLIGLLLTFLYAGAIFKALGGIWNPIVLTDTLRPVFKPTTLAMGFAINMLISLGTAWFVLRRFFRNRTTELLRSGYRQHSQRNKRILTMLFSITGIIALVLFVYGLIRMESAGPVFFFTAGTLMLISLIILAIRMIRFRPSAGNRLLTLGNLAQSNLYRNGNRSLSVILMLAIGIFMVVAVGANRKTTGATSLNGGTGGFLYYLETTAPVTDNLNNPLVRAKYGLEVPAEYVQMKKLEGDDASCLNLNRVTNPPLLGVPAGALSGRFSFASKPEKEYQSDPWKMLDREMPGGAIPAIADMTVIQWGLGLKIGDTLRYKSESGDSINIILAGGLGNSVFQGSLLISEKQLVRHWPSVGGSNTMLVGSKLSELEALNAELSIVFRDYGADLKPAAEKLAEFNSIENTYLSIFLVMGAIAMLLSTIGLAVILARNLQERLPEIALLRASGFSRQRILWLVVQEYATLLLFGTLAGGIPALVSVLPGLLNPSGEVSFLFLLMILIVLIANGLLWIVVLGRNAVRKRGIVGGLRNE
jgi:ABC-type antimicrobial peptide transport system permease subunit